MVKFNFIKNWKQVIKNKRFLLNLGLSLFFFILTLNLVKIAGLYAEARTHAPAIPDFLHQFLPLVDVSYLANFGFIVIQAIFWFYFLANPKYLPKTLKVYGIFLIFRSVFISLTHLGAPALRIDDVPYLSGLFSSLYFTQDLFPSGHTAMPFIGYLLVPKKHKFMKYFMLVGSLVMGTSVLLLHVHYSIDVLGAFFIAYGSVGVYQWLKKLDLPTQLSQAFFQIKIRLTNTSTAISK